MDAWMNAFAQAQTLNKKNDTAISRSPQAGTTNSNSFSFYLVVWEYLHNNTKSCLTFSDVKTHSSPSQHVECSYDNEGYHGSSSRQPHNLVTKEMDLGLEHSTLLLSHLDERVYVADKC